MLLTLPNELLCLIARHLDNRQDLYHLASICRRLYGITRHGLFTRITLCNEDPVQMFLQARRFLATILQSPTIAAEVRFLDLGNWTSFYPSELDHINLEYDEDLLNPLVDELDCAMEEKEEWKLNLESGLTDAWVALLLPRLPNLQRIRLVWPYQHDSRHVLRMLEQADPQNSPMFSQLREVHATTVHPLGAPISMLLPFFKFPAIRKIVGLKFYDSLENSEPLPAPPSNSSEVTDLDLQRCESEEGMEGIIACCKALKSFRLTHGGAGLVSEGIFWRGTLEELFQHRTTLESVSLCIDLSIPHLMDGGGWEARGFFEEFASLKHLHIGTDLLLRILEQGELKEILPLSLESLYICGCKLPQLEPLLRLSIGLIEAKALPKLASLCIVSLKIDGRLELSAANNLRDNLRSLCQGAGISLSMTYKDWWIWEEERLEANEPPGPEKIFQDTLPLPDWCTSNEG